MKILIVGGKGFIGTQLKEALASSHEVVIGDLPELDILRPETIAQALTNEKPDVVINLAAILGGMNAKDIHGIFAVNFFGNLNLVEACKNAGVQHVIFSSSLTVYGGNDHDRPVTIDTPFNPRHAYGASKAASEFALREYAKQGMTIIALRPTIILGDTKIDHAPIDFIKTVLAGNPIEIFGTGDHEREWIWISDAVQGFVNAVEKMASLKPGYHAYILSGNRIKMKDLAEKVAKRLGGRVNYVSSEARAFTLTANAEDSNRKLGWRASVAVDDMIEKLIPIIQARNI